MTLMFSEYHLQSLKIVDLLGPIIPLLVITGTLNICRIYSRKLKTTEMKKIILPVTLTFFVPPLIANLVYKQYSVTNIILGSFFIGCLVFPVFNKMPLILNRGVLICYFGKFGLLGSMKNNNQKISNITLWLIVNEFVGIFILKLLSSDFAFAISEDVILKILGNSVIVYFSRAWNLSDGPFIVVILLFDMLLYFKQRYLVDYNLNLISKDREAKGLKHYFTNKADLNKERKRQKEGAESRLKPGAEKETQKDLEEKSTKRMSTKKQSEDQKVKFTDMDTEKGEKEAIQNKSLDQEIENVPATPKRKTKQKIPRTPKKSTKAKLKKAVEESDEEEEPTEKKKTAPGTPKRKK